MPTEIVPLVHAVNQALDRLERGFRAQREFTGDMAHELRTPLTIIRARVDSLEPGPLRDELRTDLENMTRIVNQVLDIAELESFIVAGDARADLQAVCAEAVAFMAPLAVGAVQDHRARRQRAAGLGARPFRGAVPRRAQPDRERHPPRPGRRVDRGRGLGRRHGARARRRAGRARGRARIDLPALLAARPHARPKAAAWAWRSWPASPRPTTAASRSRTGRPAVPPSRSACGLRPA